MPSNVDLARGPGWAARPSAQSGISTVEPPRDLLPLGGPASEPIERRLGIDALTLLVRLDQRRRPARWTAPAFVREVELVRSHLTPLRDVETLAASFGREAFNAGGPTTAGLDVSPVRVAYAIRWLELRDGVRRPHWRTWLDAAARRFVDDPITA